MAVNFWQDRNVLVTGATGLLGSWVTQRLVANEANVTILCRDRVPKSKLIEDHSIDRVNVVYGGLENYFLLLRALNEYEVETVFHLGAQTIVTTAYRNPISTFESNIKGTWNILEACRNVNSVQRVVVASTDKAYGSQKNLPYTEESQLNGEYPYDVSKSCADMIARAYNKTYGLPVAVTRCGNLYGAGDLNFDRLIPGTIKSILLHQEPTIRSDGTYIRDYLYLKDVVDAYFTLAEKLTNSDVKGEAFNLSTKNKMTVIEVVNLIIRLMRSKLKPKILNKVKGEIRDQYLSSEKAERVLGWKAHYTLEQGLRETIPWYRNLFSQGKL
jgi:CDP-glucose 4,6-dehydratase